MAKKKGVLAPLTPEEIAEQIRQFNEVFNPQTKQTNEPIQTNS